MQIFQFNQGNLNSTPFTDKALASFKNGTSGKTLHKVTNLPFCYHFTKPLFKSQLKTVIPI